MHRADYIQLFAFLILLIASAPLLGRFIANVFAGKPTFLDRPFGWIERGVYRLGGIDPHREMNWKEYAWALMAFNLAGIVLTFLIQTLQGSLPLNPDHHGHVPWHTALNAAVSFVTNTNWQSYAGETVMSYFTQMAALTVQNFVSAATGMAVAIAFARGLARSSTRNIGNFWSDLVKGTIYVLVPLSIITTLFLVSQGVTQTFSPAVDASTLEGAKQVIAVGPVASQIAIKQIGTNGGGFFNANAAHPFENPTPLTNFLQMFLIFLVPGALVYAFGIITGAKPHARTVFGAMLALFLLMLAGSLYSEFAYNPVFHHAALLEGKETRFGVFASILFSVLTTSASCGAVNAMHSSLSPLSGGIALLNMHLGEIIFGGVGAGLYGMLLFIILTVFIAGLLVGRTPEYLGKKIEAHEIKMTVIGILAPSVMMLLGTGFSVVWPKALASLSHTGPHGFSEMLYAFTSAAANNGSAFAGLNADTVYFNLALALSMFIGRFGVIIPALAIAGSMAQKKRLPQSAGTFEVDTPLFGGLLIGIIVIIGGLTFFPALALGPIIEHLLMLQGVTF